jgi:hypothetical protein
MGPELEYAALCADCRSLYGLYYMSQHPRFFRVLLISKQTDEKIQTASIAFRQVAEALRCHLEQERVVWVQALNNPLSVHHLAASARSAICRHTQDFFVT